MKYSVTIDVPDLDEGLAFYRAAFGFEEAARPFATYAVLKAGAAELGLRIVAQDGPDKQRSYEAVLGAHGYRDEDVAYMGDDLLDLPVIGRVGLSAAPADAVAEVRARVDWVSGYPGGRGAVREFVEMVKGLAQ